MLRPRRAASAARRVGDTPRFRSTPRTRATSRTARQAVSQKGFDLRPRTRGDWSGAGGAGRFYRQDQVAALEAFAIIPAFAMITARMELTPEAEVQRLGPPPESAQ